MKIRPILFSTPMVEAILNGSKTQTRRLQGLKEINIDPNRYMIRKGTEGFYVDDLVTPEQYVIFSKFTDGDILWVRETWQYSDDLEQPYLYKQKERFELLPEFFKRMKWMPSIFMPKEACRLFLECTNVRVERLHDISEKDAIAEGISISPFAPGYKHYTEPSKFLPFKDKDSAKTSFFSLWMSINGAASLDSNPWVFAYDFKITECPTNFLIQ